MIESVAFRAPTSPPETGASIDSTPRAFAAARISCASVGSLVVMSTRIEPGCARVRASRRSPRTTSRTSRGKADHREHDVCASGDLGGRIRPHGAALEQRLEPVTRVRENTVTGYPASSRCPHIDEPITPLPIQPSDSRDELGHASSSVDCGETAPYRRDADREPVASIG